MEALKQNISDILSQMDPQSSLGDMLGGFCEALKKHADVLGEILPGHHAAFPHGLDAAPQLVQFHSPFLRKVSFPVYHNRNFFSLHL